MTQAKKKELKPGEKPPGKKSFDPTVDRFLVALQKTLSRVSRDSAKVSEDQARSLIVGNVDFEADLRCELREDEKLQLRDDGGIPLKLTGRLNIDTGVLLLEEIEDASSASKKHTSKTKSNKQ